MALKSRRKPKVIGAWIVLETGLLKRRFDWRSQRIAPVAHTGIFP
jgi:hypothetical protein